MHAPPPLRFPCPIIHLASFSLSFPSPALFSPLSTLLLGELVLDPSVSPSGESGPPQSRFLATDLLVMSQTVLPSMMPLDQRLRTVDAELIGPLKQLRDHTARTQPHVGIDLHVRAKMLFPLAKVESAMRLKVAHGHEGIVVQMNGKQDTQQPGYKFVYRKADPQGISEEQILQLARTR